ncbi:MAG: transcription antitermination factor NusB [Lachnospiraceae bacterium]|nr:transcription antitermination factor NusB [Lachnospiraceae bacterium]
MKTDRRTQLREVAFLLLFRLDFYPRQDLEDQIRDFFDGEDEFTDEEKEAVGNKVLMIASLADEIDEALNQVSVGWKVKRMSRVDLTILRLAYYEIKYDPNVPVSSAINEAVELAKSYGEENSPSFVNGILAKVAKDE